MSMNARQGRIIVIIFASTLTVPSPVHSVDLDTNLQMTTRHVLVCETSDSDLLAYYSKSPINESL